MKKIISMSRVVDEVIASEIEKKGGWQWVTPPNYKQAREIWDEIEKKAGLSEQPQEDKNFFEDVLDELIDAKFDELCNLRIEELYDTADRFVSVKNGHYVFKNNNRFRKNKYTEEEATLCNSTLKNCLNCTDCKNCTNCSYCENCTNCTNCEDCVSCDGCDSCRNCVDCRNCVSCEKCDNCVDCTNCEKCEKCQTCEKCTFCKSCDNSVLLEYCENCSCCHNTTFSYSEFNLNHSDKQYKYLQSRFEDCKICEELKK
jgi:hypothetical protein